MGFNYNYVDVDIVNKNSYQGTARINDTDNLCLSIRVMFWHPDRLCVVWLDNRHRALSWEIAKDFRGYRIYLARAI
jgi:hypothetical protein